MNTKEAYFKTMSEIESVVESGIESLRCALAVLRDEHSELVRFKASERSITHLLACQMKRRFEKLFKRPKGEEPGWRIDCEYNRVLGAGDTKTFPNDLLLSRLGVIKGQKVSSGSSKWKDYLGCYSDDLFDDIEYRIRNAKSRNRTARFGVKSVVPDIIIHTREYGGLASNALVVEVKPKHASPKSKLFDLVKLSAFTSGVEGENGVVYNKGIFLSLCEQENQSWIFRYGEDEPTVF